EFAIDVLEQYQWLPVFYLRDLHLDHVIRMPVGQDQVRIAVVVIVEKLQAPAAQQSRGRPDFTRLVSEGQILFVVIKAEQFLINVGDEQVLPAVAVEIGRIN